MAGQSAKKQVASNTKILKEIHLITWTTLVFFGLFTLYFNRPASSKPFIFFSLPSLASLFVLEKTGRPRVDDSGKIIRQGQDLSAEGLTEYLFDVIYYTIICQFLAFATGSNKMWWLYLAIPAFAGYKVYGLISAGKEMFGMGKKPAAQNAAPEESQKSKRQQKMEKRGDKPKMRYR
ncbi:CYFA0S09e01486g1_1 [Cyberlindnera fabianii]|uniref:CYFA0S09e01486g1_1 n=1 Tax=Cyberlindnera fabianii TaxID=36022 RepID=A0A061B3T5_CYBFA|nr:CYFA0S09e01486g1_1 [Cyberlindnera fabianii]